MFNHCVDVFYTRLFKYQRTFLGLAFCIFCILLMLENHGKSRLFHGLHVKKRNWTTVKSSVSDIKSSIAEVKSVVTDMVQDLHVDGMGGGEFGELGNMPDIFTHSKLSNNSDVIKDPLQPGVSSQLHLNRGPAHDTKSGNIFKNETVWDVPKHWLPSWEQKHELSQKEATHPLNFDAEDVLVFLHIPKTSGKTFNAHLVTDMRVPKRLECHCMTLEKPHGCKCMNSEDYIWLFSRLTTAWPCGVHPSWSDLSHECLNRAMDRKERKTRQRK